MRNYKRLDEGDSAFHCDTTFENPLMRYHIIKKNSFWLLVLVFLVTCTSRRPETKILLYSDKDSPQLEQQLRESADKLGWGLEKVEDHLSFNEAFIQQYSLIVTNFSSLSQLNHRGVVAMKRYLEAGGGGIVAVKDTTNTQNEWPWLWAFNTLEMGRPIKQDNGNLIILSATFSQDQLETALKYSVGSNGIPDYNMTTTLDVPDASRYTHRVLTQGMDEPMEMAILPDNKVLFVERKGAVKLFNDSSKQTRTIAQFNVFSGIEDGLLGVALDPDFKKNKWVYFYYSVGGDKSVNRLSRMELRDEELIMSSEKVLLEIPTQRIYCCHSAGYLSFGPDGLLYLSTGDNTNAEETEGYVPIDERPGRGLSDDQATAANSNDLRGKILRIKPEPDGSYSIPDGNLFPKNDSEGRPEIYIMGCRNPYRYSIDQKNKFLYFGDVGPDTKVPARDGTLSFDEINQAKGPGFFGWPYFLGNNEAFPHYDFATKVEGPKFDPANPLNQSPHNTGTRKLPPAQPAMIWYGDGTSKRFPLIGNGGESAMAGPVYYSDLFPGSTVKLPEYYNKKLLIYDWVRRWFMAVSLDDDGRYVRMEPFLDHMEFVAPTDIQFGHDGALYIMEYGTNWFAKNNDARLIRIEYSEGNRKPVADIKADHIYGAVPFTVQFTASGSMDYDEDDVLQHSWQIQGKMMDGEKVVHTFQTPGTYEVSLTVTDNHGEKSTSMIQIRAGNEPPVVKIKTSANRSFYWDNVPLDYMVEVKDKEDLQIDQARVEVSLNYLPQGKDVAVILTNPRAAGNLQFSKGQTLLNQLDCKACHSTDQESVGPSYSAIAKRYVGQPSIVNELALKVIEGGTGKWGQRPMSSHPDLSVNDSREIVQYILSLNDAHNSLPTEGTLTLKDHVGKGNDGSYLLMASYTDKGANQIEPLFARAFIALRNPLIQIEDYDEGNLRFGTITTEFLTFASGIRPKSFAKIAQIDLSLVKHVRYRVQSRGIGGNIEMRLDSKEGNIISTFKIPAGSIENLKEGWKVVSAEIVEKTSGIHDVYFVFTSPGGEEKNLFNLDWVYFSN
ncbi:MAG: PQQ-dependent sugar dehydrogenase [Cyclobacteriaceae bacterium]